MGVKKRIILVTGARPNFVKVAPLVNELKKYEDKFDYTILHTGQHYDFSMSDAIFEDLDIPEPDIYLGVGSGTHAEQTGKIMIAFEKILMKEKYDLVVVFGDVNSTLACTIASKKLHIPIAHVEAGLRSFDEKMPEEINRKVTDILSEILFVPSRDATANLLKEGISEDKIFFVGNIMIDSLLYIIKKITEEDENNLLNKFGVKKHNFLLVTLHRPGNVDDKNKVSYLLETFNKISSFITVIFPMHPRTRKNIEKWGLKFNNRNNFLIIEPLRYKDFVILEKNARLVVTDSGGVQQETTIVNVPCLTVRKSTEWSEIIKYGTNELVSINNLYDRTLSLIKRKQKKSTLPPLWDGRTSERIIKVLSDIL